MAGLSAALSLAEAGLAPLVLEADPSYCGGRYGGLPPVEFSYAGREWRFPGEHGIHGIWSQYHTLRELWERHSVCPPLVPAERQEWVYGAGQAVRRAEIGRTLRRSVIPAPFHYLALLADPRFLAMLGPLDLLRIPWVGGTMLTMLALDPMHEGERLEGLTVNDFLLGWPRPLRAFAGALARSGLSTGTQDVPLAGFVALFRFYSLLRRDASAYHYLRGDPDAHVFQPMLASLRRLGGTVKLGAMVTHLERGSSGAWRVHWRPTNALAQDGEAPLGGMLEAEQVVLATDAPAAGGILRQGTTTGPRASSLHWPEGRATATVRLWFRASPNTVAEAGMLGGDFLLDNFFWLHLFQDAFTAWHQETGGSALESHIYGPPELLAQDDATLLTLAVRDILRAFPDLRGSLVRSSLQRHPPTHTLFSMGAAARHLGVATPWLDLYCCGDWVRHETPALFLERACVTGLAAANAVRASHGLPSLPLPPHAPPEATAAAVEKAVRAVRALMVWGYRLLRREKR